MKLYIGNGTHQNLDFQYRLPEYRSYRTQPIAVGGQTRISGDLTPAQIDIIIQFHTKYGMIKFSEISNFRGFFIPYIYRIDEAISKETLEELIVQNRVFNANESRRLRAEAALAVSAQIEDNLNGEKISNFQMEIEEKPSKERDATMEPETFQVTRDRKRGAPQEPGSGRSPISVVADFIRNKPKQKAPMF
jgi:hypothetical protein